jgi:hypothetical protein
VCVVKKAQYLTAEWDLVREREREIRGRRKKIVRKREKVCLSRARGLNYIVKYWFIIGDVR